MRKSLDEGAGAAVVVGGGNRPSVSCGTGCGVAGTAARAVGAAVVCSVDVGTCVLGTFVLGTSVDVGTCVLGTFVLGTSVVVGTCVLGTFVLGTSMVVGTSVVVGTCVVGIVVLGNAVVGLQLMVVRPVV
jgi:hypothetical protein